MDRFKYFSDCLNDILIERNIAVKELSDTSGITDSRLYDFLSGNCVPSVQNAVKLANSLHCTLDYLFGFDEEYNYCQNYVLTSDCSERLRQAINASGKTRYKISKETKVSQQQLHNWYRNKQIPSLVTLVNFADYFNCSLDYLVGK
ncbi:MAG TPA: helix-turn-helix transcriptional regulator [Candidatus Ornithoclostridium faecavium]|nr:helix-turn-helix transcriptional regulator [Candidatus Ornithoclostridium faecavium]